MGRDLTGQETPLQRGRNNLRQSDLYQGVGRRTLAFAFQPRPQAPGRGRHANVWLAAAEDVHRARPCQVTGTALAG